LRWNEVFLPPTPASAKKDRKREHADHQPQVKELFDVISDNISISILRLVSGQGEQPSPKEIMEKMKISRKKYYSRISKLRSVGLLKVNKDNNIQPSVLGRVVFNVITTLDNATNVYMKLRTIDAVELSGVQTKEELDKLIDSLIEDENIKSILKKMTIR
jgi:DNA-binding HxlR family transcriptional regulator